MKEPQGYWQSCRWVPWTIVACFAVVFAVNGALAWFAVNSDTGLVNAHPFELGNGYNKVLDEAAAQEALGWHGTARFDGSSLHGEIVAQLADGSGGSLDGLTVTAHVVRPVEPMPELVLSLSPHGPGRYAAALDLPRAGQWEIRVSALRGGQSFQFAQRIVVR
jgi:nitrogen fixation protein FixH